MRLADRVERPPLQLELMQIFPDRGQLELVFRGGLPCDKQLAQVARVELLLHALDVGGTTRFSDQVSVI